MLQFKVLLTISNLVHTDPYLIVLPTVYNVFFLYVLFHLILDLKFELYHFFYGLIKANVV